MKRCRHHWILVLLAGAAVVLSGKSITRVPAFPDPLPPIPVAIDHVLVCTSELGPIEQAFSAAGLQPDYGGRHNNPTEMAQLGFEDGTYIGIEAPVHAPAPPEVTSASLMNGNAGPCGWAANTPDIHAELERVSGLGIQVGEPELRTRSKPDGNLIKWWSATLGPEGHGVHLPFLMQDITRHQDRTHISASTLGTGLTGVAEVVIGVKDLDASTELFRRVYRWPAPRLEIDSSFGARMAYFEHTPVVLAAPLKDSWLSDRVSRFGNCPAAFLLGTRNFNETVAHFSLPSGRRWFNRKVSWFDAQKLQGMRLGVIGQ